VFVGLCVCLWCLASTSNSTSESVVLWVCFVALENVAIRPEGISVTFLPVSLQPGLGSSRSDGGEYEKNETHNIFTSDTALFREPRHTK
jgi:hypothetical protein